jgi:hypothetical protein
VDYLLKTLTIDQVDYLFQIWDTGASLCSHRMIYLFKYFSPCKLTRHPVLCSGSRAVPSDHDFILPNGRRRYPHL